MKRVEGLSAFGLSLIAALSLAACSGSLGSTNPGGSNGVSSGAPSTDPSSLASIVTVGTRPPDPTAPAGFKGKTLQVSDLPQEAADMLALIGSGGPFPSDTDGSVYTNSKGLLPKHAKGYYHEYTVVTPGSYRPSTRHIVAGNGGERYYSSDNGKTFVFLMP